LLLLCCVKEKPLTVVFTVRGSKLIVILLYC
jgi:hypothetical protein